MVQSGTIKWFDNKKGFGFILRPEDVPTDSANEDIFVHQSATGEYLTEGDDVEFELTESSKGLRALNVRKVSDKKAS